MAIHLSRPDVTEKEIEAVCAVLRSPNLSLGPKLGEFEQAFADYIGRKRAVAVNSGTSGLFLCMRALGIGPGDEVITTPFTFIATATTINRIFTPFPIQTPPRLRWTIEEGRATK